MGSHPPKSGRVLIGKYIFVCHRLRRGFMIQFTVQHKQQTHEFVWPNMNPVSPMLWYLSISTDIGELIGVYEFIMAIIVQDGNLTFYYRRTKSKTLSAINNSYTTLNNTI